MQSQKKLSVPDEHLGPPLEAYPYNNSMHLKAHMYKGDNTTLKVNFVRKISTLKDVMQNASSAGQDETVKPLKRFAR